MDDTDNLSYDDELTFVVDEHERADDIDGDSWKIIIADDEEEVHAVTALVFENFAFEGKPLECLHSFSGKETKKLVRENPDTALIILDVVMEDESTGLDVVKFIRERLKNNSVRIILRTGQPGQAPERKVIVDYDINDYKEKTDLSSQKLFTTVISSLRSYKDIIALASLNTELEKKVEERTACLFAANEKLRQTLEKIKEDEEAGKKTQAKMLPDQSFIFESYEFSHCFFPSLYLSGDFLDYFNIGNDLVCFYLADVSGHGASSAFVTMLIKSVIDGYLEKFRDAGDETLLHPERLLSKLNTFLIREDIGKFVAIFFSIINVRTNEILYTNAGQFPPPMVYDNNTKEVICLGDKCMPVGLFDFADYHCQTIQLPSEGSVIILSDGLLEVMGEKSVQDKIDALKDLFKSMTFDINVLKEHFGLNQYSDLPDDITCMMVKKRK